MIGLGVPVVLELIGQALDDFGVQGIWLLGPLRPHRDEALLERPSVHLVQRRRAREGGRKVRQSVCPTASHNMVKEGGRLGEGADLEDVVAERVEEVVGHDAHGVLDTAGREHLCHKRKRLLLKTD